MYSVKRKEILDLGEGASVRVRGLTAAEHAAFGAAAPGVVGSADPSAHLRVALGVVSHGKGFRRFTRDDLQVEDQTPGFIEQNSEEVPSEEVTADWLLDNIPLHIVSLIVKRILELSRLSPEEKKALDAS